MSRSPASDDHARRLGQRRDEAIQKHGIRLNIHVMHLWRWHDDNLCGICGEIISDQRQASVDHIIPLASGGTESWANVRLAHRSCNSSANHGGLAALGPLVLRPKLPKVWVPTPEDTLAGDVPYAARRLAGWWKKDPLHRCSACLATILSCDGAWVTYAIPLAFGEVAEHTRPVSFLHRTCAVTTPPVVVWCAHGELRSQCPLCGGDALEE